MKYITIEDTDLKISELVFGTARAGLSWDGEEGYKLLDRFISSGANTIDTAHVYSDWVPGEKSRSERFIGDWLKNTTHKREDIILITKCGHPDKAAMHISRMTKKDIIEDLEGSLQKLGVDYIDIYLYHRDDITQSVADYIELMEQFVGDGKIRYYGCSNWSTERMKEADKYCKSKGYRGFVMNQCLYNIASDFMKPFPDETMETVDNTMLEYHKNNSSNLLVPYMALCNGFFSKLKSGDNIDASPYNTEKCIELSKKIDILSEKYSASITQILLGFILNRETRFGSLFSVSSMTQLEDILKVSTIQFDPKDFL